MTGKTLTAFGLISKKWIYKKKCYLQQYPLCEHALYSQEFYRGIACIVGGKCPLNSPPCCVGHVHDTRIRSKVHRLDNT